MTVEEERKKPEEIISEAKAVWWKNVGDAQKQFSNIAKNISSQEEGNGKGSSKTTNYVQKRSEGDHLLAESIIIGNDAYFAVATKN